MGVTAHLYHNPPFGLDNSHQISTRREDSYEVPLKKTCSPWKRTRYKITCMSSQILATTMAMWTGTLGLTEIPMEMVIGVRAPGLTPMMIDLTSLMMGHLTLNSLASR